ncbi:tetratricopeptide repeat protein [Actinomycetospora cinnamomea]|uniref:Tetratricopeptide repeat protein n=1 Tax=Actinomycetospora cinnamomea TaxID=663609 RepID=A0A2U1F8D0_9PSEU|nr:tetratricopeptide repeat protein [Actinomycetospora cinnamomea]PVZ08240.1 tetratricopeptide repeat protein [Actinomycetospora cinnamomea]
MVRDGRRSIQIENATSSLITVGDNSPISVTRADEPIFALQPLQAISSVSRTASPARLLTPRYELVGFVGRDQAVGAAKQWLKSEDKHSARLLTGAGGQGKTRFAIHLARLAADEGWATLFARHKLDGGLLAPRAQDESTTERDDCDTLATLVVIDYAERWPRDDLLELLSRVDTRGGKVRFLLLGRSGWFWPTLARTLDDAGFSTSRDSLPAFSDVDDRLRMYLTARTAFETELFGTLGRASDRQPTLHPPAFSSPLAIQMSALIDTLRAEEDGLNPTSRESPPDDPTLLTRELLVREVQHWNGLRTASPPPISISDRDMACAVAVGTLCKGLTPEDALHLLPALNLGNDAKTIVRDHSVPYPSATSGQVLEPLQPDRLGEDFLASFLPGDNYPEDRLLDLLRDPFAPDLLAEVLDRQTPAQGRVVPLVVLIEVARRWPHVAARLYNFLSEDPGKLIAYGAEAIARAAPIPALRPLMPRLGEVIGEIVGVRQHVDLDVAALLVQEQIVEIERLDNQGPTPGLASSLNTLSIRRFRVGQYDEAIDASQESINLWRQLTVTDPVTYTIELARAVGNLAATQAELGDFRLAFENSELELSLTRQADRYHGGAFRGEVASALSNQASYLSSQGEHGRALAISRESVALHEALLREDRQSHLSNTAAALESFGRVLHHLNDKHESTSTFRRAMDMRRELAEMDPPSHLSGLASSLTNLAISLESFAPGDAFDVAMESVELFRTLHRRNERAFAGKLASALHVKATSLVLLNRISESIAIFDEAVELHRASARSQRAEFAAPLAESLFSQALALLSVGSMHEALASAREAVSLYERLSTRDPELFGPRHAETRHLIHAILHDLDGPGD